ncbi:hypothetical protein PORY_000245 [Pneumocystis oryctolagi]|uniref:Uncharacterized protein n=1 Tax=Pneumocystis oryctolagi TaxID=42067 RepID=A0ACB7CEP0_9ASCO|nr:hypothetical protein PORY_000245 [Pneumocystis oryctolagi]
MLLRKKWGKHGLYIENILFKQKNNLFLRFYSNQLALDEKKKYYPNRRLIKKQFLTILGELGANHIYEGQYFILSKTRPEVAHVIMDMWNQEKKHLETFEKLLLEHKVKPTILKHLCKTLGFMLGAGTALLGPKSAMACTEAIETVIGEHYNDQLRETMHLKGYSAEIDDLREKIKKFRDDELEHLNIAVNDWESKDSFAHSIITNIIKTGCIGAIWICKRI